MSEDLMMHPPAAPAPPVIEGPEAVARPRLSKRQKAAIVVRLLRAEGVELSLAEFPEELQAGLTRDMGALRYVDRSTLRAVIEEFLRELDQIGLVFPGGLGGALDALDGTISPGTAAALRREAGLGKSRDPWDRIAGMDPPRLLPILQDESVEVAAILLAKLKVSKAAELLGQLPGERARRITYAVSQTGAVSPDTVAAIGQALIARLDAEAPRAFDAAPEDRVGAILNYSAAATRDQVLEGLHSEDADFAEQVRRAIFTFANIPARLDPRDIPKVMRELDAAVLTRALAYAAGSEAEADAAEFVLGNMSQRMAQQLREEMEGLGKIKPTDGEAAMTAVVAAIRELEASGEVVLIAEDD